MLLREDRNNSEHSQRSRQQALNLKFFTRDFVCMKKRIRARSADRRTAATTRSLKQQVGTVCGTNSLSFRIRSEEADSYMLMMELEAPLRKL